MLYLGIDQHAKQLTVSLRNDHGDVILKRQVSTEPKRCAEFFGKLREKAGQQGYIAIVEVCGFNDWLLGLLPKYGCLQTILIQSTKKPKVKTDRRDAHAISELLWVNQHRLRVGDPITAGEEVWAFVPKSVHATLNKATADEPLTFDLLNASETSAVEGAVVLECDGVLIDGGRKVSLRFDHGNYVTQGNDRISFERKLRCGA